MHATLTARLGVFIAAVATVLTVVGVAVDFAAAVRDERDRLTQEIDRAAAVAAPALAQAAWADDGARVDAVLRDLVGHPLILTAELDARGHERATASPKPFNGDAWATRLTLTPPTQSREIALPFSAAAPARLLLRFDATTAAQNAVDRLRRDLPIRAVLTAFAAAALFLALRRGVTSPVENLRRRIEDAVSSADAAPLPQLAPLPQSAPLLQPNDDISFLEQAYAALLRRDDDDRQEAAAVNRRINAAIVGADLVAFEAEIDDDGAPVAVWSTPNVGSFLGYPPSVKPPRHAWREALHPEDARRVLDAERRHIASGSAEPFQCLYRLITYDDRVIVAETTAVLECGADGRPTRMAGVNRNVTARFEAERRLAELLNKDDLTGLGNRASLERALNAAILDGLRHDRQTAAIHLDLDRFKTVNDTYGHSVADRILRLMARRWAKILPDSAAMHRLGGDEFVVMTGDAATAAAAIRLAEKLVMAADDPLPGDLPPITLTVSAGVAMLPLDGRTPDDALSALGCAVQAAKRAGGGCVRLHQARQSESVKNRIQLERELADAVARQELTLHYQPRVAADGRVSGVEALARWIAPDRNVPPGVFIPIAEETGLIAPLGLWALRAACRQARLWRMQYGAAAPKMAVNVSARQLMSPHFEADVANALREAEIPPEMIELELTESAALGQIDDARRKVLKLRELGVGVAVDDFGTGYSALSYIAKLPFTSVKIDQSFTRDLPESPAARAVVTAALQIARDLGMAVVAEGVETPQQADYLIRAGAHELQGFYYSRALPADQFAAQWLSGKVVTLRRGELIL